MSSVDEETPLLEKNEEKGEARKTHERDIAVLGAAFLMVFLAYASVQNLQSTVNTEGNLGTTSLGILYVSFTICTLFASFVVKLMGSKNALLLGTTGYWLFTAANLKPSWYTMVPASVYLGFASSVIWVGQGTYLTSTARSHAKECNLHEGTVIGNFNGQFWAVYASNQVVGNLISYFLLGQTSDGAASGTTRLFIVYLGTMTLGIILMCFLHKRDGNEGRKEGTFSFHSLFSSISKSLMAPFCNIRLLLIIPLFAYSGLQQAFLWAVFTKNIVKPALGASAVGGPMAVYGAFDAMCALIAGRLTSNLSSITLIVTFGSVSQAAILLWILLKYSTTSGVLGVFYPLLMAAVWGMGDGVFMTQINAMIGMLFKHDTQGTFAQLKLSQSACIAAVFFLIPHLSLHAMVIIVLISLCTAFSVFLFLTLRVEKAFSRSVSDS